MRHMGPLKATSVVLVILLSAVCSSAASADTIHVQDPAGDGQDGRIFDITGLMVDNGDFAVTTRVTVRRVIAPADVYMFYWIRGGHGEAGAAVVSKLRIRGITNRFETPDGVIDCKGLSAEWDPRADTIEVSFPSRCLEHGNYGAFRMRVIIERAGGSDADLAPKDQDGKWRWTRWIGRG
jgi:hypothetical protein